MKKGEFTAKGMKKYNTFSFKLRIKLD